MLLNPLTFDEQTELKQQKIDQQRESLKPKGVWKKISEEPAWPQRILPERLELGYCSYERPMSITAQAHKLRKVFPCLGDINPEFVAQILSGSVRLPSSAEGYGCVPHWKKKPEIFGSLYLSAIVHACDALKETAGRFVNEFIIDVDELRLRESVRSNAFWEKLSESQGNPDILIVPFQFGLLHRERSAIEVREMFLENEFGLGAFATICLLVTHTNRLARKDDLCIDCPGDEVQIPGIGDFEHAPSFGFMENVLEFWEVNIFNSAAFAGSVTGFLPEMTL